MLSETFRLSFLTIISCNSQQVTKPEEISAAASFVEQDLKSKKLRLVALVNNAGMSKAVPLEANSMTLIKQVYGVNVFGLIETTQAFLPQLRNTGTLTLL